MNTSINVTDKEAMQIGTALGIDWRNTNFDQFRRGIGVELEHGLVNRYTDVTHDDLLITGKIALAHLNELPDYYSRLEVIEDPNFKPKNLSESPKNNNAMLNLENAVAICCGPLKH